MDLLQAPTIEYLSPDPLESARIYVHWVSDAI